MAGSLPGARNRLSGTHPGPLLRRRPIGVRDGGGSGRPLLLPDDAQVYLDLSFFQDLSQWFGAPGDFADAYVIAHEIGHHVQNVLGVFDETRAAQARGSQE